MNELFLIFKGRLSRKTFAVRCSMVLALLAVLFKSYLHFIASGQLPLADITSTLLLAALIPLLSLAARRCNDIGLDSTVKMFLLIVLLIPGFNLIPLLFLLLKASKSE